MIYKAVKEALDFKDYCDWMVRQIMNIIGHGLGVQISTSSCNGFQCTVVKFKREGLK